MPSRVPFSLKSALLDLQTRAQVNAYFHSFHFVFECFAINEFIAILQVFCQSESAALHLARSCVSAAVATSSADIASACRALRLFLLLLLFPRNYSAATKHRSHMLLLSDAFRKNSKITLPSVDAIRSSSAFEQFLSPAFLLFRRAFFRSRQ